MTTTSNDCLASDDETGVTIYKPYSQLDEQELKEASVLIEYQPPNCIELKLTLSARLTLRTLENGGRAFALAYELTGRKRIEGEVWRHFFTDIALDESIINKALADNDNPVLMLLLEQKGLANNFFDVDAGDCVAILEAAILELDVKHGPTTISKRPPL